jgi:hypothetical protein
MNIHCNNKKFDPEYKWIVKILPRKGMKKGTGRIRGPGAYM